MKNLKKENGAITIIVLVSVLFMVSFLISSYILIANKVKAQKDMMSETKNIYESKSTMEEIYNSYIANSELIPIYNLEQLLNIGSDKTQFIDNKYYTFTNDATYILMNDIEYSETSEATGEYKETAGLLVSQSFKGQFEGNDHKITITNNLGEKCICNDSNNFNGILIDMPSDYKDKTYNIVDEVPIPKGFKYVKGSKSTGIVITDDFTGEESKGNEFVWIPVDGNIITFSKTAFNGEKLSTEKKLSTYWLSETSTEYVNLKSSVEKYKGFYIGRFETSADEQSIAQIKRGYIPWTNVKDIMTSKSSSMYDNKQAYKNYISTHLVYPQEWDATMNWIIKSGAKTEEEVKQDSSSWGIYDATMQETGSDEKTEANNIYDLAGNVSEFTQENYGTIGYISVRGGYYNDSGSGSPAASRTFYTISRNYIGFRICMMINL